MKCNVSIVFFIRYFPFKCMQRARANFRADTICWCLVRCLELVCVCSISLQKYFVHENDHDINMDTNVFMNTNIHTNMCMIMYCTFMNVYTTMFMNMYINKFMNISMYMNKNRKMNTNIKKST